MTETINLPLTINGETREVEVNVFGETEMNRGYSVKSVGLFQKRQGQKIWPDKVWFWKKDGVWKASHTTTILNRAGYRLIKWNDGAESFMISKHNSAAPAAPRT